MILRRSTQALRLLSSQVVLTGRIPAQSNRIASSWHRQISLQVSIGMRTSFFHTSSPQYAQGPTADALMENLEELYYTAKDEFEIAAEETEKKTVYAEEDREAAKEALNVLKEAFEKAVKESGPEVGKEVQRRVGNRLRELENALTAVEEMAMED